MKIKFLPKMKLQKFSGNRPCQNVVMKCDKLTYVDVRSIKDLPIGEEASPQGKFILFLDQITDPQNFGSIIRSAMFLGVDSIVVNRLN
jgi:23S rRNA (guanosine2251-2'-O)-methyltransferase